MLWNNADGSLILAFQNSACPARQTTSIPIDLDLWAMTQRGVDQYTSISKIWLFATRVQAVVRGVSEFGGSYLNSHALRESIRPDS
jgi:hypothetical protein